MAIAMPRMRLRRWRTGNGAVLAMGLAWLCLAAPAQAAGDRALGEYLSSTCAACHQASGRQLGGIPAVIGHPVEQFVALMSAYRTGERDNAVMRAVAGRLTPVEIEALAAYYGELRPQP